MKTLLVLAAILPIAAASASAAAPGFYSGRFPLTITKAESSNLTSCLVLTDNGQDRFPHSGPAALDGGNRNQTGTFQIVDRTLLVDLQNPGSQGQQAILVFSAPASSGIFGVGVFLDSNLQDVGKVVFGNKGGC